MNARSLIFGVLLLASFVFATADPNVAMPTPPLVDPLPALNFRVAKKAADGPFEFRVDWAWPPKILIESSTDLVHWTSVGLHAPNTLTRFTDTPSRHFDLTLNGHLQGGGFVIFVRDGRLYPGAFLYPLQTDTVRRYYPTVWVVKTGRLS